MHPIRLSTHSASACLAAVAASALTGTSAAATVYTTLHSASLSLTELNGSPVSSSTTYTGPSTGWSGAIFMNAMSVPNTGTARLYLDAAGPWDRFGTNWVPPGGVCNSYTMQMVWDVTFNSALGGVILDMKSLAIGSLSVTPLGGSATAFDTGDVLGNGRYTFTWDYVETQPVTGVSQFLFFLPSAPPPPGGGVPLPGAAGLAAIGLFGVSRRRKR